MVGASKPEADAPSETVTVGRDMAEKDPRAFLVAQEAVRDWLERFPGFAEEAGRSDGGETGASRLLIEAFSAASAAQAAAYAGDGPEAIFNEVSLVAREQVAAGMTKAWVLAFMQIRCIAVGYMLAATSGTDVTKEFWALSASFLDVGG
jgi:hypothetical protein